IGAVAAATRHGAGAGSVFPSLIGAAAGVAALYQLLQGPRTRRPDLDTPNGRRTVLTYSLVTLGGAVVANLLGRFLGERRNVSQARSSVVLPTPESAAPALPADQAVAGQTPFVTQNDAFYKIDTELVSPQVDPNTWQLRIHGMVEREMTITYQ